MILTLNRQKLRFISAKFFDRGKCTISSLLLCVTLSLVVNISKGSMGKHQCQSILLFFNVNKNKTRHTCTEYRTYCHDNDLKIPVEFGEGNEGSVKRY